MENEKKTYIAHVSFTLDYKSEGLIPVEAESEDAAKKYIEDSLKSVRDLTIHSLSVTDNSVDGINASNVINKLLIEHGSEALEEEVNVNPEKLN